MKRCLNPDCKECSECHCAQNGADRKITPGKAIRAFCLACLGCTDASGAFDCLNVGKVTCGIYPAHPFRGKQMPVSKQPRVNGNIPERISQEESRLKEIAEKIPGRKASGRMIAAYCREQCQPEDRTDCRAVECPFYPWHPYQPGGRRKRPISQKTLEAAKRNLSLGFNHHKFSAKLPIREVVDV